jgi:hypothetical protein
MENGRINHTLDELMTETVVVRAVDDGDGVTLEAPADDTRGPYESNVPFEHWAQGKDTRSKARGMAGAVDVVEGAKAKLRFVQGEVKHRVEEVRGKVSHAGGQLKAKAVAADQSLRARPYVFALGAVAVGFALGRLFMTRPKTSEKYDVGDFKDYTNQHTGVHIRQESRYAGY